MDLIDRQAAIDAIHCDITVTGKQNAELVASTIGAFVDRIKALPSAQPEQKKGEWLLGFDNRYLEKYYYCSKCGGRKYEEHKSLDYFCSNCGADMRGEKDV